MNPSPENLLYVTGIYEGSNGDATKALYAGLEKLGPIGIIAVNLFRAQKCSSRAKAYKGRGFKGEAYDRKNWSLKNLCDALAVSADKLGIIWGWKEDPTQEFHKWVLYIDLPDTGSAPSHQVSFHAAGPLSPQRYTGEWDQSHDSPARIIRYVASIL